MQIELLKWFDTNYFVVSKHVELSRSISKTKDLIPILCENTDDFFCKIKNKFKINENIASNIIEENYSTMLMYSKNGKWLLNILPKTTLPLRYYQFIKDTFNILSNKSVNKDELRINFSNSNISRELFIEMLIEYSNKKITTDVVLDFITQTQLMEPYFRLIEQHIDPYMIVENVINKKINI